MSHSIAPETQEETATMNDFRNRVWRPFQRMYDEQWNQAKWEAAVEDFLARHDPAVVSSLRSKRILPPWNELADRAKKGPPPFLRPGWTSPLLGKQVDLSFIDADAYVWIRGSRDGWRDAKVLVVEFWASWCSQCHHVFKDLSEIVSNHPTVKVITFNREGIFDDTETDIPTVKKFVFGRSDLNYPIFVDHKRVATNALFRPSQNLSIPLAFIITPSDRTVRWLGNAEEMKEPLANILAAAA